MSIFTTRGVLTPKLWAPLNLAFQDTFFGTLQNPIRSLHICFWGGGTICDRAAGGAAAAGAQNTILRLDRYDKYILKMS